MLSSVISLNQKIQVVLATSSPDNAITMLNEIRSSLPSYDVKMSALYIGQSHDNVGLGIAGEVNCIGRYEEYLSIAESRNKCQSFLKAKLENEGGIGFVLDDDLRWVMPEHQFAEMCAELRSMDCDMALCALSGDAPIPKEYTRASPLLDVLVDLHNRSQATPEMTGFLNSVSLVEHQDDQLSWHHDFYAYKRQSFTPTSIDTRELDWDDFFQRLYLGKTTTRRVVTPDKITPATGRERGGATIVFNPNVLSFKNISFSYDGICSRRSDMMMATGARQAGYKLVCTPELLAHERTVSFDSHNPQKLVGDIMGYALIESYSHETCSTNHFEQVLSDRLSSTLTILQDTSTMLKLLQEWLSCRDAISPATGTVIGSILLESQQTESALQNIDACAMVCSYKELALIKRPAIKIRDNGGIISCTHFP